MGGREEAREKKGRGERSIRKQDKTTEVKGQSLSVSWTLKVLCSQQLRRGASRLCQQ